MVITHLRLQYDSIYGKHLHSFLLHCIASWSSYTTRDPSLLMLSRFSLLTNSQIILWHVKSCAHLKHCDRFTTRQKLFHWPHVRFSSVHSKNVHGEAIELNVVFLLISLKISSTLPRFPSKLYSEVVELYGEGFKRKPSFLIFLEAASALSRVFFA